MRSRRKQQARRLRKLQTRDGDTQSPISFSPDYSRCVGVELGKACFIGILLQVCGFAGHPRREIAEFAKLASASGEALQRTNQTPVVVNNSGSAFAWPDRVKSSGSI
jgi:hypothetical protein